VLGKEHPDTLISAGNLAELYQAQGRHGEAAFDISAVDFSGMTNETGIPSGFFLAYYSDVRLFYVAGFNQANIPPIVKQATASIITAKINTADMAGGVKMARAGDAYTPFREPVGAALVKPSFDRCEERWRKAIFAASLRGIDARQPVELLRCDQRPVAFWQRRVSKVAPGLTSAFVKAPRHSVWFGQAPLP
jgi:hypothetical protein